MADNYLENQYERYLKKKQEQEAKKMAKLKKLFKEQIAKSKTEDKKR